MNTLRLCLWTKRVLSGCVLLLLLVLTGCDGGIFGTGDGSVVTPVDGIDAGSSDLQPPEGTGSPTDGSDQPSSEVQPDASDDTQAELRPFENLQIGSNSNRPLIALVNLSAVPLNASTGADDLFMAAILPGAVSDYASIALESTQLTVTDAATAEPLLVLSPLNLGAFSVSTVIARDRLPAAPSDTGSPTTLPDVEIIAVPSQQLPSDDGVARVRLLQSSALDSDDRPASMSLIPADALPGGSEADLGNVSAATFGTQADYRLVAPGSYRLVDSLGRLTPIPVELISGEFHTLILTGLPVELLVLRDSQARNQGVSAAEKP